MSTKPTVNMSTNSSGKRWAFSALVLSATLAISLAARAPVRAQTFQVLHSFDGTDGAEPTALVQAAGVTVYGTTFAGGSNNDGTIFKITATGTLTTLYNFEGTDGSGPDGLVQAAGGSLYGTTEIGGTSNDGTVFEFGNGTIKTLHIFDGTDGSSPDVPMIQATNGNLWGTTQFGGRIPDVSMGTIFQINPDGVLTTVHNFCSDVQCLGGKSPQGVIQASNGILYGAAGGAGPNGGGTIFELNKAGLTTLYGFSGGDDGSGPVRLIQATNGNLYGTTEFRGANGGGTVFEITLDGTLTTLYSFCSATNCADGKEPVGGLIQASDGNLYGVTFFGGFQQRGTVFEITLDGTLRTLYSFCSATNCADGNGPVALIQASDGNLYGETTAGGSTPGPFGAGDGTVFEISLPSSSAK